MLPGSPPIMTARGKSGHGFRSAKCPLMTQSGHRLNLVKPEPTGMRGRKNPSHSTGASNCAHHFGRARAGTFAEQLILQDCVSHGNRPLLLTVASGAAAALAAGDDNEGGAEDEPVCGVGCPAAGCDSVLGDKSPVALLRAPIQARPLPVS